MKDFRSTVLRSTPSFALHILEVMQKKRIDPRTLSLKVRSFRGRNPGPGESTGFIEDNLGDQSLRHLRGMELVNRAFV